MKKEYLIFNKEVEKIKSIGKFDSVFAALGQYRSKFPGKGSYFDLIDSFSVLNGFDMNACPVFDKKKLVGWMPQFIYKPNFAIPELRESRVEDLLGDVNRPSLEGCYSVLGKKSIYLLNDILNITKKLSLGGDKFFEINKS